MRFEAAVELPPDCGAVVGIDWDFDGTGAFPFSGEVPAGFTAGTLPAEHRYETPGVYFACARVIAQRDGNPDSGLYRAANLGRIRVIFG